MKKDPFQIPTSAELRDGLRGDITKLTAEVARLTAELQGERDDLAEARGYNQRLIAENVRLSNEAADVRKELEKYQDSLEVMTTDNNATFEGINAALDAAGITFLDVDTYAACIGRLAAQRDDRNAYAERLLSENVRLTNEAATERERCGVLAEEVLAYREWQRTKCDDNTSSLDHWHACKALDAATLETDTRHALDPAKFEGKP